MNVVTCVDGVSLMDGLATLPDCQVAVRTAHWALSAAQKARDDLDAYKGPDAAEYQAAADRRVTRCMIQVTEAEIALDEKKREADVRNARNAKPVTIPTHRARHMFKEADAVVKWLDQLSLTKPTDFDFHARFEMRRKLAWVCDMLNEELQPISIITD